MSNLLSSDSEKELWIQLKRHTAARIGLARSGVSISTKETLAFKMDHAFARDAVYSELNVSVLVAQLQQRGIETGVVRSRAIDRQHYLQRPDLGRILEEASAIELQYLPKAELVFILADGLSAEAINRHAIPVLTLVLNQLAALKISIAPVILAQQGRVALADDIGSRLEATLALIFIGERPGLTSPDSMGVYLTYGPKPGNTDEVRNCISNIRPEGLTYERAAEKILYLIQQCLAHRKSGVSIKDNGSSLDSPSGNTVHQL